MFSSVFRCHLWICLDNNRQPFERCKFSENHSNVNVPTININSTQLGIFDSIWCENAFDAFFSTISFFSKKNQVPETANLMCIRLCRLLKCVDHASVSKKPEKFNETKFIYFNGKLNEIILYIKDGILVFCCQMNALVALSHLFLMKRNEKKNYSVMTLCVANANKLVVLVSLFFRLFLSRVLKLWRNLDLVFCKAGNSLKSRFKIIHTDHTNSNPKLRIMIFNHK